MPYPFTNILGWSHSRYQKFNECKRQYFFQYYSNYSDTRIRNRVKELRNLTTIKMETGSIVHELINVVLERLRKNPIAEIDRVRFDAFAINQIEISLQKNYFEKVYNAQSINRNDFEEKVTLMMNNFFESEIYRWIRIDCSPNRANWIIEPKDYGETRIDNLKAYCKVDALIPTDGETYIIDWKTGSEKTQYEDQLKGYAVYAHKNLDFPIEKIVSRLVYLSPTVEIRDFKFSSEEILEFSESVKTQTEEMYNFCTNIESNNPKSIEAFVLTENESLCKRCNFKEICNR